MNNCRKLCLRRIVHGTSDTGDPVNARRQLLLAIGAATFLPWNVTRALDAAKRPRIGILGTIAAGITARYFESFRDELERLGHIAGKTVVIDYRTSEGDIQRIPGIVHELVESKVDVL